MNEFNYPIFAITKDGRFFFPEEEPETVIEPNSKDCFWLCRGKIMVPIRLVYCQETFSYRSAYSDLNRALYKYV